MNLLVQFPTLKRPQKFLSCLSKYLLNSSELHKIKYNINCDVDDEWTNSFFVKNEIAESFFRFGRTDSSYQLNFDKNTNKISSINDHIQGNDFDIVICASDDMIPQVKGWDNFIVEAMTEHFPDLDGCVHFNDGHTDGKLITFSILGKKLYDYFGYIYHPDYKSLYCDDEFTQEVRRLGKEKYIDKVIISHEHYSIQGTANDGDVDYAAKKTLHYSGRDQFIFEKRKEFGFPKQRITDD